MTKRDIFQKEKRERRKDGASFDGGVEAPSSGAAQRPGHGRRQAAAEAAAPKGGGLQIAFVLVVVVVLDFVLVLVLVGVFVGKGPEKEGPPRSGNVAWFSVSDS